jgi:hypothetical protein
VGKEEFGKIRPYLISGNYPGIRTLEGEICTVKFKTRPDLALHAVNSAVTIRSFLCLLGDAVLGHETKFQP